VEQAKSGKKRMYLCFLPSIFLFLPIILLQWRKRLAERLSERAKPQIDEDIVPIPDGYVLCKGTVAF
jgi:hypothetical protein